MSIKINDEIFLLLHCEKNSNHTRNLVLQGNDLQLRINRRIWDCSLLKICFFLKKFTNITSLNLCYNNITDEGFTIIVDYCLSTEHNLEHLNIAQCDITDTGIKYMCEKVKELKIKDVRLNGNKFGSEGGKALALYLNTNEYVEYLDIAETDQTLSSIAYFMKILNYEQGENKTIKILDLSRIIPSFNRYNYNDEHLSDCISILLNSNQNLVELHLQKCNLDGHDIQEIVIGLKNNKSLLFLDLGYNRIGDVGLESLANILKRRPPLLGLNVAGNGIGDYGARVLSFYMPYSRVRLLDISNNKISSVGILDILNTIKKPVIIRILNIWGNNLSHKCNVVINRMFKSGVLNQNYVDVKIYVVDDIFCAAFNPSDRYKHKYYCELDYACAVGLTIKRNVILDQRKRIDFKFYPNFPKKERIVEHKQIFKKCYCGNIF